MNQLILSTGMAAMLAQIGLGGGLFEHRVIDPCWPANPSLIQPKKGGVKRSAFWILAHLSFELSLIMALVSAWEVHRVRDWLLIAFACHLVMRVWSALDFIPKAIAFEKAETYLIREADAKRWTRRSLARLPLAFATAVAMMVGFAAACQAG